MQGYCSICDGDTAATGEHDGVCANCWDQHAEDAPGFSVEDREAHREYALDCARRARAARSTCEHGSCADECAMVRERSVAGRSNTIPACPMHGP